MQVQNFEKKRALITGITGQDGSYLSEYLLEKGYQVFGLVRPQTASCVRQSTNELKFVRLLGDLTQENEKTPFNTLNPYATAKVYAHQMARIYRESYGLYIASGILFNHESERRPLHFLTQKVAYGAACAALGIVDSPDMNEMGKPIV